MYIYRKILRSSRELVGEKITEHTPTLKYLSHLNGVPYWRDILKI